ncbi:MAG TPA: hypothetical protein VMW35_21545 [Myxococcota bacterium]|jgi:exonuclease SbcC|nr:hypothetical protein [Myxococcota bacterium]
MYEHVRAGLTDDASVAQQAVQQATAARDGVRDELNRQGAGLPPLQAALDAANATLDARNRDVAAAQAVVSARASEQQQAQDAVEEAEDAYDRHGGDEPPAVEPGPAGQAQLRQWQRERAQLRHDIDAAKAALAATRPPLAQAQQTLAAAAAVAAVAASAASQARDQLNAATSAINATRQRLADAEAAIVAAQHAVDAIAARMADLDRRAAVLVAAPLDRTTLEPAADLELADLQACWQRRHDLFAGRANAIAARGTLLAAHDTTVDDLAALRSQLAGWSDTGRWPALAGVVSALASVIAANAAQRGHLPLDRADDLAGTRDLLAAQLTALQSIVSQATAERDQAQRALDQARDALVQQQEARP